MEREEWRGDIGRGEINSREWQISKRLRGELVQDFEEKEREKEREKYMSGADD